MEENKKSFKISKNTVNNIKNSKFYKTTILIIFVSSTIKNVLENLIYFFPVLHTLKEYILLILFLLVGIFIAFTGEDRIIKKIVIFYFSLIIAFVTYYGLFNYITYEIDWKWLINIAILSPSGKNYGIVLLIMIISHFIILDCFVFNKNRKEWRTKDKIKKFLMMIPFTVSSVLILITCNYIFLTNKEIRTQKIYNNNGVLEVVIEEKDDGALKTLQCYIKKDKYLNMMENIIIFKGKEKRIPPDNEKEREIENRKFRKVIFDAGNRENFLKTTDK